MENDFLYSYIGMKFLSRTAVWFMLWKGFDRISFKKGILKGLLIVDRKVTRGDKYIIIL